jgi:hypothetical protein
MKTNIKPRAYLFEVKRVFSGETFIVSAVTKEHAIGELIKLVRVKKPPFIYEYEKQWPGRFNVKYYILTWKNPRQVAGTELLEIRRV